MKTYRAMGLDPNPARSDSVRRKSEPPGSLRRPCTADGSGALPGPGDQLCGPSAYCEVGTAARPVAGAAPAPRCGAPGLRPPVPARPARRRRPAILPEPLSWSRMRRCRRRRRCSPVAGAPPAGRPARDRRRARTGRVEDRGRRLAEAGEQRQHDRGREESRRQDCRRPGQHVALAAGRQEVARRRRCPARRLRSAA